MLECISRSRGGDFSKIKRLVAKWMGTREQLFSVFFGALVGVQKCRNAGTLSQGIFALVGVQKFRNSELPPVHQKKLRITVSVFTSTF